ncbi:MAG: TIGR03936 family radical SAM-associated protein [Bifidobacteriaceae bacterium]|jgi:hypothetical protein|nr:TIGR03936 family radical SAM-associated protein [Bifidobacteriaceae bacterium]
MPSTPAPPPAVQTLALRYAKRGPLRFASHRVIQRVFERAVRRAGLPIAFSAGFTPHPRISYLGAAPTGAASEAEYLLIRLTEHRPPDWAASSLNAAMPRDLPIITAVTWDSAIHGDLGEQLAASLWRIELGRADPARAGMAAERFLACDSYAARRIRPGPAEALGGAAGPGSKPARPRPGRGDAKPNREVEVRGNTLALQADAVAATGFEPSCAILDVVLRHATPAVRPDDVIAALVAHGLEIGSPPRATRLAQGEYSVEAGAVTDPFSRMRT